MNNREGRSRAIEDLAKRSVGFLEKIRIFRRQIELMEGKEP